MIPKYTINLLSSLARWLDAKSNTIWAKSFGHSTTMKGYAKSLNEIVQHFKDTHDQCERCGGTDGPLLRAVDAMDCHCVPRELVVKATDGQQQHLTLTSEHSKLTLKFPETGESTLLTLMVTTGQHYKSVDLGTNFGTSVHMRPHTFNMLVFASLPTGGYVLNSVVYDIR